MPASFMSGSATRSSGSRMSAVVTEPMVREEADIEHFQHESPYVFEMALRKNSGGPEAYRGICDSDDIAERDTASPGLTPTTTCGKDWLAQASRGTSDSDDTPEGSNDVSTETCEWGENDICAESNDGGYVWYAQVLLDDFNDEKRLDANGKLKARRPFPHILASDLLANIKNENGRFMYVGFLNGWPGLANLELRSITKRVRRLGMRNTTRVWQASNGEMPAMQLFNKKGGYRARFQAPWWSKIGWSLDSPGFVWWYYCRDDLPIQMLYGEAMLQKLDECTYSKAPAAFLHAFAHRYPAAGEKETIKERQTWHAGILVEWSHGRFGTILELGFLNGIGGYCGRSNWVEDKREPQTRMDKGIPDCMKAPWDEKRTELRITDVPQCKNRLGLEQWLAKYSDTSGRPRKEHRFIEPVVYASAPLRIRRCGQAEMASFLLNYISRVDVYELMSVNCQTFAADAFAFFCGRKDAQPYGKIMRPRYRQRSHSFLYMPNHLEA
eukprot:TRINITY_DN38463_c0_g1_i1.p1 TRINITY_DN38463_c0_g1~~TRINITY_DN38463_c0_g1_i1.p1  ORF type:complete len:513 (+),score=75.44 TRINITY_DN38463_c0_g1_i1:51-1541(+)